MSQDTPTTPAPTQWTEAQFRHMAEWCEKRARGVEVRNSLDPVPEGFDPTAESRALREAAAMLEFAASLKRREEQRDEELRGFIQEASLLSVRMANSMMTPERLRELLSMPEKPTEAP